MDDHEQNGAPNTTPNVVLSAEQLQQLVATVASAICQAQAPREPKTKIPDRPNVDLNCSEGRWAFFINEWKLYKRRIGLLESSPEELRACCSQDLRLELFNYVGPIVIDTLNETQLLENIRRLAVKGKNKAVHRQEFYAQNQDSDQPVQQFIAQLRAKAEHCNFTVQCTNCTNNISYAEQMISDQLTVGLYDKDIQGEILAKDGQLTTFSQKFALVQALEDGKRTREQLGGASAIAVHQSAHRRQNRHILQQQRETTKSHDKPGGCSGCGSTHHGRGTTLPRKEHCPAWSKRCEACGTPRHIRSVCRKSQATSRVVHAPLNAHITATTGSHDTSNNNALTESSSWFFAHGDTSDFTQTALNDNKRAWKNTDHALSGSKRVHSRIVVPHLEWSDTNGRFTHRRPRQLPRLTVRLQVLSDTHNAFHRPIQRNITDVNLQAIADTGAQTCACGPDILHAIGLTDDDLVPTSHCINGVTQSAMDIAGVFFAAISSHDSITKQMIYVGRNIQGLFLSEKALVDLGIIPAAFPLNESSRINASQVICQCPARQPAPPRPKIMPYRPTEENVQKLQQWILNYYANSAFNICEHQPLPCMSGQPLAIHFRPNATPTAHHSPIPVPYHWKSQVKSDLDRDVRLGIIEPVPPGTPTVWCSRMVVVPKKDGTPRRTVDLQSLNAATYRLTHHTPSPFNQASLVPSQTWKTALDAWNGYHSMHLDPSASAATTFITEWGRYRYLRAPQGSHVAGDGYTKAYDDFTVDFPRKTKCIDDSLLWDDTIEQCFWHTVDYITLCASNGVVFNPKKFQFAKREIEFAGFTIAWDGIKPSAKLIDAIKNFPKPQNITDARSWFGLVNQVAYSISTTSAMQPFRDLLKPGKWYWDASLENAFEESKASILRMIEDGVRSFEPNRPTCLATDWSKTGLGFTLLQKHCRCPMQDAPHCCKSGWRLIYAGSRFTSDAESRYAPIEGEALAIAYALEKCRMFILGCKDLIVVTDHKPLTTLLGDTSLDHIKNPRLFRIKEKTLPYVFTIKHVPGSWHCGPDACSRFPTKGAPSTISYLTSGLRRESDDEGDRSNDICTSYYCDGLVQASLNAMYDDDDIDAKAITLDRVRQAALKDSSYQTLSQYIINGFPHTDDVAESIKPFWKLRDHLSSFDGICVYDGRVIVPLALRKEVLDCLHSAHQGTAGMKARASRSVFWPGINAALASRRAQCRSCNRVAPSQPAEPLHPSPSPAYPFQRVVADYFHMNGHQFLIYADRYTGWITIGKCEPHQANAPNLCRELRTLFGVYGAPEELSTDGGQPFAAHHTQQFLRQWGVTWRVSSAYYAQSNGRAELAVKTAKRLLMGNMRPDGGLDSDRFARALLQYRNTPLPGINASPAQLLYGRTLRDHIPSLPDVLQIRREWLTLAEDRERALAQRHLASVDYYNEHTKPLPPLQLGDSVSVQNQTGINPQRWDKTGRIVEILAHGQYVVRMDGSGRCSVRNRRFLRRCTPFSTDTPLPPMLSTNLVPTVPVAPVSGTPPATTHIQQPLDDGRRVQGNGQTPQHTASEHIVSDAHADDSGKKLSASPLVPQQCIKSSSDAPLRRSTRRGIPSRELSPNFRGQYHSTSYRPNYHSTGTSTTSAPRREGDVEDCP